MKDKSLIIVGGPTATGKSSLSIALARRIGGEIISADSMQIYKYMDIGTAKVMPEEMQGVRHYLVDELEPDEEYNVVVFKQMATQAMTKIRSAGHIPIVTGGTGFYIQALLRDIHFTRDDTDPALRKRLQEEADKEGGSKNLYEKLKAADPDAAAAIHPNNVKRVMRALEFYYETGKKISEHNREEAARTSPYNFAYFVLDMPRHELYANIEKRIDLMMERGLLDEVRLLKEKGYSPDLVSMQGLGYKELFPAIDGKYSEQEAVRILKRDTRRFAKRQLTWFRREKDTIWLEKNEFASQDKMLDHMEIILKEKGII